ncbi:MULTISPECIES: hypothetical protein [Wolbachia]|uniref:hypothetical protein n=1 Tax=Wolbachia TaxID=953 RepID=UPI002020A7A8|nr:MULTISPECIES: hypothetical protein [unclassified Wolbachia]
MVPGSEFDKIETYSIELKNITRRTEKISRVELQPLDSEDTIKPILKVTTCTISHTMSLICLIDNGKDLVQISDNSLDNCYSFVYYDGKLMQANFVLHNDPEYSVPILFLRPVEYQYLTWEELDDHSHKCYFQMSREMLLIHSILKH